MSDQADNVFDELLRDFQRAYARYGDEVFFLFALTGDERNAEREQIDKVAGCLGFVPLGEGAKEATPGYYIFGPVYKNRFGQWVERWEEPYETFRDLAARAGAALPANVRDRIAYPPAGPITWWLAFMWWWKPPTAHDLLLPAGKLRKLRVIWSEPFLEAAEVIERGGLCMPRAAKTPTDVAGDRGDPRWQGLDQSNCRLASEVIAKHSPYTLTVKDLSKILDENPNIRRHKPYKQRLWVHLGDWYKFHEPSKHELCAESDDPAEIEQRTAVARNLKYGE